MTRTTLWMGAWALLGCALACADDGGDLSEQARIGQQVYRNICTACHAGDPNVDGAIGPAIAGSSAELIAAKVLRGDYPPGYTPKRTTQQMPPLPHLEPRIGALAAYLAAAAAPPGG